MITLSQVKEWLRIDEDNDMDDNLLNSLIAVSESDIEMGTSVNKEYINNCDDEVLKNLYLMAQRIIITNRFNEKSVEDKAETSYMLKIEARYKVLEGYAN